MQNNANAPLLRVEHLRQYFSRGTARAVDDVSFDIYPGEVFGLVGESGCGKTTTGRSIIKLHSITGGSIYFKGQRISAGAYDYAEAMAQAKRQAAARVKESPADAAAIKARLRQTLSEQAARLRAAQDDARNCERKWKERRRAEIEAQFPGGGAERQAALAALRHERLVTQIQMIFQDPATSLDPRMTVREIIAEGLRIRGIRSEADISRQVAEVLARVGLHPEYASRYPHEFSGGQRQRIGIARAIIMRPALIIADEPVSALDVSIKAQVINLLNSLRRELGLTLLFIAHDLSVVKYFSDRIAVMYFGKIVELAPADELFAHPLHPYTKSLLSAIPLPDPDYEKHRARLVYVPAQAHDYSAEQPSMREVAPGHLVYCNGAECGHYRRELER